MVREILNIQNRFHRNFTQIWAVLPGECNVSIPLHPFMKDISNSSNSNHNQPVVRVRTDEGQQQ